MKDDAQPFDLMVLVAPTAVILLLGFLLSLWITRKPHWSLFVAVLKSGVFLVYYGFVFDGTFTFLDDWTYIERGGHLLREGISAANIFSNLPELFSTAGGKHFVYYLYNADSFRIFGQAYYAPVALNIMLTFVAAAFMAAATRSGLDFSKPLAAGLFVFLALHPDVLVWSTIMNGKDTLVLTGTAIAVYTVSRAGSGSYISAVVLAVALGVTLSFTRFYVPLMLAIAVFAALMLSPAGWRRPGLWLLALIGLGGFVLFLGMDGLADAYGRFREGFVNPLYGIPRMLLTPIPFNTTEKYAFLDLPQVFHWVMMPALVFGVYRIWHRATITARFVVLYFLAMIVLYGMFENLQGPRHRYQLDGIIALFQFYGALGILRQVLLTLRSQHKSSHVLSASQP